jgi:hypothetical protein
MDPAGQDAHDVRLSAKVPAEQAVQVVEPLENDANPFGHGEQSVETLNVPA